MNYFQEDILADMAGLDYAHTMMAVSYLARYHAASYCYRCCCWTPDLHTDVTLQTGGRPGAGGGLPRAGGGGVAQPRRGGAAAAAGDTSPPPGPRHRRKQSAQHQTGIVSYNMFSLLYTRLLLFTMLL